MSEKNEWKPIDSAPKDGTGILGYWDVGGIHDCNFRAVKFHRGARWETNEDYKVREPTHWMPLPAAPGSASSAPGDAQDERTGGDVAYGIYRTRPDENGGKEFFYGAMWHDGTTLSKGERMVRGRFIPDGAPAAGDALEDRQDWMECEMRHRMVTDNLRFSASHMRDKEHRCRNAYQLEYMGAPMRWLADAYAEAAAVLEAKLAALAAQVPQQGEA